MAAAGCGCADGSSARCEPRGEWVERNGVGPAGAGPIPFCVRGARLQSGGPCLAVDQGAPKKRPRAHRQCQAEGHVATGLGELRDARGPGDGLRDRGVGVTTGDLTTGDLTTGDLTTGVARLPGLTRLS